MDSDIRKIEKTISSLLPDEEYRKVCLSLFAEAIEKANSYGGEKWGVHHLSDKIRLLIGNIILFTIHKNGLWLSLDKQLLSEMKDKQGLLEQSTAWRWDGDGYPEYSKVPSRNGHYFPSRTDLDIWPIIREFHFGYIQKVTEKYDHLRIDSQRKHAPAVLQYLEEQLQKEIPKPNFGILPEQDQLEEIKKLEYTYKDLPETEREAVVKSRIGQGEFRKRLVEYWSECAVTGCGESRLLKASHIKPWRDSDNSERINVFNGLLLTPNLDSAFDQGFITFDNEGKIIISKKLSEKERKILGIHPDMKLRRIEPRHVEYLAYHRENLFN